MEISMKFKTIITCVCLFALMATNVPAGDSTSYSPVDVTPKSMPGVPIGGVIPWTSSWVPDGFLECNGQHISSSAYPDLVSRIGTQVPDLRGEFVRGWDHGRGTDSGRALRSAQGDAIRNITGTFVADVVNLGFQRYDGAFYDAGAAGSGDDLSEPSLEARLYKFDASRVVPTANENRPRNTALMYIIRAK